MASASKESAKGRQACHENGYSGFHVLPEDLPDDIDVGAAVDLAAPDDGEDDHYERQGEEGAKGEFLDDADGCATEYDEGEGDDCAWRVRLA